MKKNLLNTLRVKVILLFVGLFFNVIVFAQTTITTGQIVDASTITPGTAVTINAGGTLNMNVARTFSTLTTANPGTSNVSGGAVLTLTGLTGLRVAADNNLSIAAPISTTQLASANLANNQTSTVSGIGSISTATVIINGTNGANNANFVIGAGLTVQTGSVSSGAGNGQTIYSLAVNGILKISGAIASNGGNAINNFTANAGSIVEYNGAVNQDVFPANYSSLTLSGNGIKAIPNGGGGLAAIAVAGNITIGAGTTFQGSNNKPLSLSGNWVNNGTFTQGAAAITFNGNVAQSIGGLQATTFRSIVFENTNGGITLTKPITITEAATFTSGVVTTDATNLLIFNDGAMSSLLPTDATTTSYVNGPVRKIGNDAFVFPVGKANGFVPLSISAVVGAGNTFTAEYIRTTPPNRTNINPLTLIQRISACEYWTLDRNAGATAVNLTLYWNANSPCGGAYITDVQSMRAVHYNGTQWDAASTGFGAGTPAAGSVTWGGVNTFSPFALGTTDAVANPLPVVFANVKAYGKDKGVQIEWSNLTEKDVASYSVERSANGTDFSSIAEQLPTGNQNDQADYSAFDASPVAGVNYYRIKAVETTGKTVYSKVLSVSLSQAAKGLSLYPNPVSDNQVTISLSNIKRGQYNVRVVTVGGQDVHKQTITNQSNNFTQTIGLPSTIKPGVYNMIVTGLDYRESKMFIVQ